MDHLGAARWRNPRGLHPFHRRASPDPAIPRHCRRRRIRIYAPAILSRGVLSQNHGRGPRALMTLWIIARVTFLEAARRKIVWTALLGAGAFVALFAPGRHYQVRDAHFTRVPQLLRYQILSSILQIGFYAIDLLAVLMTVLTSVDTISGEIASSTIHAIATKPIHRSHLLLGKWLGFAAMIAAYVALGVGGVVAIGHFVARTAMRGSLPGAAFIYLECLLVLTLT